jgi:tight adherence protein C
MDGIFVFALILFLLMGLALVIFGWARSRRPSKVEDRLEQFGTLDQPPTLEEIELSQPFSERVLAPLLSSLAEFAMRFSPRRSREALQHKLDLAGNPLNLPRFVGLRVLATILFGGLGLAMSLSGGNLTFIQRVVLPVAAAGLGYYLPLLWLGQQIRRRQSDIIRALPDALDLLTICVEAGLGFDAAMAKVAEKWNNELSLAFNRVLQEIQLGKARREALREMADRIEIPDVSTFVAAVIQASQLGVSLARVLRIQSDQLRVRRRQRAEELARAATIKILPPVAFLILPALLVVLLGPAAIQFMTVFGEAGF